MSGTYRSSLRQFNVPRKLPKSKFSGRVVYSGGNLFSDLTTTFVGNGDRGVLSSRGALIPIGVRVRVSGENSLEGHCTLTFDMQTVVDDL